MQAKEKVECPRQERVMYLASFAKDDICYEARKLWIVPSVSEKEGRRKYGVNEKDTRGVNYAKMYRKIVDSGSRKESNSGGCCHCKDRETRLKLLYANSTKRYEPDEAKRDETRMTEFPTGTNSSELCQCVRCQICRRWVLDGRWTTDEFRYKNHSGVVRDKITSLPERRTGPKYDPYRERYHPSLYDRIFPRSSVYSEAETPCQRLSRTRHNTRLKRACDAEYSSEDEGRLSPGFSTGTFRARDITIRNNRPCLASEVSYSRCVENTDGPSLWRRRSSFDYEHRLGQRRDFIEREKSWETARAKGTSASRQPGVSQPVRTVVTMQPGAVNRYLHPKGSLDQDGCIHVPCLPARPGMAKASLPVAKRASLSSVASTSLAYNLCWKCFAASEDGDSDYTSTTSEEEGSDSDVASDGAGDKYDVQDNSVISCMSLEEDSSGGSDSRGSEEELGNLDSDNSSMYEEDIMVQEALLFGENGNGVFGSDNDFNLEGGATAFDNETISDSDEYFGDTDDEDIFYTKKLALDGESVCCKSMKTVDSI